MQKGHKTDFMVLTLALVTSKYSANLQFGYHVFQDGRVFIELFFEVLWYSYGLPIQSSFLPQHYKKGLFIARRFEFQCSFFLKCGKTPSGKLKCALFVRWQILINFTQLHFVLLSLFTMPAKHSQK